MVECFIHDTSKMRRDGLVMQPCMCTPLHLLPYTLDYNVPRALYVWVLHAHADITRSPAHLHLKQYKQQINPQYASSLDFDYCVAEHLLTTPVLHEDAGKSSSSFVDGYNAPKTLSVLLTYSINPVLHVVNRLRVFHVKPSVGRSALPPSFGRPSRLRLRAFSRNNLLGKK